MMDNKYIVKHIAELEEKIAALPMGSLSTKKIKGSDYYYHRVTKNGKRIETYVAFEDVEELRQKIELRKALQKELKRLKLLVGAIPSVKEEEFSYKTSIYLRTGKELEKLAEAVKKYKKRGCYEELYKYVFGEPCDKVFILYGLRRTGKTTLIRQILANMTSRQLDKAAFIQIKPTDTLSEINNILKQLEDNGFEYVFVDEVTLMEDFIEGAALFSDIYASSGMKIILSGTDSLGFAFAENEQLYDRCILLHTTFIPYREFENVLGVKGIDEYIKYGGTMSMGGVNYNEKSSFASEKSAEEYVDSAIAHNIQHSLKYYQDGGHFRHLYELYKKSELTSVINRVVEDINHRFTKEVLTKTFRSGDISISARNLLHDKEVPIDILRNIDRDFVETSLKKMLYILDKEEQSVNIDENHAYQIKEYLELLDLIVEIDLVQLPNVNTRNKITAICQPGIRYAQAESLIKSLLLDEKFNDLSAIERNIVQERILAEIKGRMMEEIVLLETKLALPKKEVFQLQFAVGEFDMVIYDPETISCEIFEIKYSSEVVENQYRHLVDEKKCADTEHRFGAITGKKVIYRGETHTEQRNINYINVEDYLKSLK